MQAPTKTIADIMRRNVKTIGAKDDLASALQLMLGSEIRHLPVLHEGQLVGVLSERDVVAFAQPDANAAPTLEGTAEDAMTSPVESVAPGEPIANAAAIMAVKKVGCLPVLEGEALVGMVTTTDLLAERAWLPIPR